MKKQRQLHLWIGLITSIVILVEAVTGLVLSEPWLVGMNQQKIIQEKVQMAGQSNNVQDFSKDLKLGQDVNQEQKFEQGPREGFRGERGGNSVMGFIKNLHAGKIGNTNIKIVADITAIGLIILTVTGISISVKILTAQYRIKNQNNLQT